LLFFHTVIATDQIRGQEITVISLSCVAKRIQKTWKRRTFQYLAYLIETLQQAKDFDCYDIKHLFQEINFSSLNQFFDFYSAILNIFPRLRLTK